MQRRSDGSSRFEPAPAPDELLRLAKNPEASSYAQYFAPLGEAPGPVVVMVRPYAPIAWTGEEVDLAWADEHGQGGCFADVNGPDYDLGPVSELLAWRDGR